MLVSNGFIIECFIIALIMTIYLIHIIFIYFDITINNVNKHKVE